MFPFLCSGGAVINIGVHASNFIIGTSVTTPAIATTTGSTIVVAVTWTSTTFTSITDSVGNPAPTQILTEDASTEKTRMYYFPNITGNANHTFTLNIGASQLCNIAVVEIKGASTSAPLDQADRVRDTSSPFTLAAGLTTTQANEALVTFIAGDSGSNPATMAETGLGSSTIQEQNTNGATQIAWGLATEVKSSTGTFNPSWTQTGATNGTVWLVTIK